MAKKISDYFCVGTSGPTVDGRELEPRWFIDSGKKYDPALYQAFVWLEHYRWYGNFGEIIAMKSVKQEDGAIKMYNRIMPSDRLIELNRAGQKLHSSVEIVRDFAKSGMAYQIGLGVTDSPASVATDRLKFSASDELSAEQQQMICNGISCQRIEDVKSRIPGFSADELEVFTTEAWPDLEFKTEKSFFDIGSWFAKSESKSKEPQQDAIDMNEEQFKSAMGDIMKPFSDKLDKFATELAGLKKEEPENPAPAGDAFSSADHVKELKDEFDGLKDQVTELMNKIDNTPAGSSNRPEADGGNGGEGDQFSVKETW